MRWSLFSLIALLLILIVDVTALPTPQDGLELGLERRGISKTKKITQAKKKLRASSFKKSSLTYRKNALKSTHPMLSVKSGKIVKSKAPTSMPSKMDAGTYLEIGARRIHVNILQTTSLRRKL